ncbi:MAG: MliC family protein [Sulfuritalea sp.]|nr:MliC family protein [Sulfuritalea sp.]
MQRKLMRMSGAGLACIPLLLAGCGEMNVKKYLPFGSDTVEARSRTPVNATEYQCAAGKRFYVRTLDGGAGVWLILPEREVRLDKLGSGSRYSNGIAVLEINGNEATLQDGATSSFSGCKAASSP